MTRRYGRATRLFKARGSQLTPPSPAGSWPPEPPPSDIRGPLRPPIWMPEKFAIGQTQECEPGRVWSPTEQDCVLGPHEECPEPGYWSWDRFDRCWHTKKYGIAPLAGSNCRVPKNVMVDENGIASGGCVPQPCDDFYPADGSYGQPPWYWSWMALDCVPTGKPNEPYIDPGGLSKRSTGRKIRRKGRRGIRRGRVSRRSRTRRRR